MDSSERVLNAMLNYQSAIIKLVSIDGFNTPDNRARLIKVQNKIEELLGIK